MLVRWMFVHWGLLKRRTTLSHGCGKSIERGHAANAAAAVFDPLLAACGVPGRRDGVPDG
jgi:hypothetical protein